MTTPECLARLKDFSARCHLCREDRDALNIAIAVLERVQEQRESAERPHGDKVVGRVSESWRTGV